MKINKNVFIAIISVLTAMVICLSITSISLLRKSGEESVAAYNSIRDNSNLIALDTLTAETSTTTTVTTIPETTVTSTETTTEETITETETTEFIHETVPYAFHDPVYYEDESRIAEQSVARESESIFWEETENAAMNNFKKIPTDWYNLYMVNDKYFEPDDHGIAYNIYVLKEGEIAIPEELTIPLGSTLYIQDYGYFKVAAYDSCSFMVCLNNDVSLRNEQDMTNKTMYSLNMGNIYLYTGTNPDGDKWIFAY